MSPWAYFGSIKFFELQKKYGFSINHYPLDIVKLFSLSGGEPLPKRSEQRKAYRMMELKRWQKKLNIPINFNPKYFPPSNVEKASCLILSNKEPQIQNKLSFSLFKSMWLEEKDIGDENTLSEICQSHGLDYKEASKQASGFTDMYNSLAEQAASLNVFGSPSYVLNDEVFWGQDRLDLLEEVILNNK